LKVWWPSLLSDHKKYRGGLAKRDGRTDNIRKGKDGGGLLYIEAEGGMLISQSKKTEAKEDLRETWGGKNERQSRSVATRGWR